MSVQTIMNMRVAASGERRETSDDMSSDMRDTRDERGRMLRDERQRREEDRNARDRSACEGQGGRGTKKRDGHKSEQREIEVRARAEPEELLVGGSQAGPNIPEDTKLPGYP